MKTLVQFIMNASAAAKAWLLAADAAAQKALLSLTKSDVGLGNVDNTSDASKPVSTAQAAAIAAKIGGSVGSVANRLVKSLNTDTLTVTSTGITVDASNNVSGVGTISSGTVTTSGNLVAGGLTINPTNGASTLLQTFAIVIHTSNMLTLRHGNNDYVSVRPNSASGTYTPAGYGAIGFANTSNALGAYIVPTAAGTLAMRTAAHGDANLTAGAITASGLMCAGVYTFATVPSASSNSGKFLRISDRSQKHAYSDGTNWRFFGDDAIIS